MNDILQRSDLQRCQQIFAAACAASRAYDSFAKSCLVIWGSRGPEISGCVREHFTPEIKDTLRGMAKAVSQFSSHAFALKPRGVRMSTMINLYRAVQARDGIGFYG